MNELILKQYKSILLETFKEFICLCKNNNLTYFASGGTAIGAVRHNGIIPWDDDIDVYMKREDYQKLLQLKKVALEHGSIILDISEPNYIYPFAKFCRLNSTVWETEKYAGVCGVYIDIFPLDYVDEHTDIRAKKKKYESLFQDYQLCFQRHRIKSICSDLYHFDLTNAAKKIKCLIGVSIAKNYIDYCKKRFIDYESSLISSTGSSLFYYHCTYKLEKEIYPASWFDNTISHIFEDFSITLCSEYDKYLSQLFGDYMTPPPAKKQCSDHPHYYLNLKENLSLEEVISRISQGEYIVY